MKKKFVATVLSLVMCFAVIGVVAGCSGGAYDDSAIKERIEALEEENQKLKDELNAIKGGDGSRSTVKVYKFGETATYYDNGSAMFSIKYVTKATTASSSSGQFTFTNIGVTNCALNQLFSIRYVSSTSTASVGASVPSTQIRNDSVDISLFVFGGSVINTYNRVAFYSPATLLTYAIFDI